MVLGFGNLVFILGWPSFYGRWPRAASPREQSLVQEGLLLRSGLITVRRWRLLCMSIFNVGERHRYGHWLIITRLLCRSQLQTRSFSSRCERV